MTLQINTLESENILLVTYTPPLDSSALETLKQQVGGRLAQGHQGVYVLLDVREVQSDIGADLIGIANTLYDLGSRSSSSVGIEVAVIGTQAQIQDNAEWLDNGGGTGVHLPMFGTEESAVRYMRSKMVIG